MYHEPFTMYNVDPVGTNSDSELPSCLYHVPCCHLVTGKPPNKDHLGWMWDIITYRRRTKSCTCSGKLSKNFWNFKGKGKRLQAWVDLIWSLAIEALTANIGRLCRLFQKSLFCFLVVSKRIKVQTLVFRNWVESRGDIGCTTNKWEGGRKWVMDSDLVARTKWWQQNKTRRQHNENCSMFILCK